MSDNSSGFANQQSSSNGLEAKCSTSLRFAYLTQLHIGAFDLLQAVVFCCCFWVLEVASVERFISILKFYPPSVVVMGFKKNVFFGEKQNLLVKFLQDFWGLKHQPRLYQA